MEPQQNPQNDQDSGNNNNKISVGVGVYSSASSSCNRQSSTRWTPTTDQIRILKDLYYNNGVRSPTADQIQRISARLRQYGKIEGKNVFYWFQNHKARERQKKRFSSAPDSSSPPMHQRPLSTASWKPLHDDSFHSKYPNFSHGVSSASPSVGGNYGYGSVTMERAFRDCGSSGGGVGGSISHNLGWVGHHVDPYSIFDKRIQLGFEDEEEEEEDQDHHYYDQYQDQEAHHHHQQEIETLPLFPMHGEDIKPNFCDATGWYRASGGGGAAHGSSRTSLELSLNSYNGMS